MRIVVLRHATREKLLDPGQDEYRERWQPLSFAGKIEASGLADQLRARELYPEVYFTSCFVHARQTGELIRDALTETRSAPVVELCTLTPHFQGPREWRCRWPPAQMLHSILAESEAAGHPVSNTQTVMFVLHTPRLQQLAASMTSWRESEFERILYSQGVCLAADSPEAFLVGAASVDGELLVPAS